MAVVQLVALKTCTNGPYAKYIELEQKKKQNVFVECDCGSFTFSSFKDLY